MRHAGHGIAPAASPTRDLLVLRGCADDMQHAAAGARGPSSLRAPPQRTSPT